MANPPIPSPARAVIMTCVALAVGQALAALTKVISLNTAALMPLMIVGGMYVLFPVVRWVNPPRKIADAYGLVCAGAAILWMIEAVVYFLGSISRG